MPALRSCLLLAALAFAQAPAQAQTVPVIEYYNASQDHYFMSSLAADIAALDSGQFPGWTRTGQTFAAYPVPTGAASPVCRFYIPPALGDSHFYSASPAECAQTHAKFPLLVEESAAVMYVDLPDTTTGACPAGDVPVFRVWDNRADSNHRYTTDWSIRAQMLAKGWIAEGYGPDPVIMCAPRGPRIASISVCAAGAGPKGSCPAGNDTIKSVLAPGAQGGGSINAYGGLTTLADEHATVLPPGTVPGHADYLFFAASRTHLDSVSSGVVVMTGGAGPDATGQWTFDFAPDYGAYSPAGPAGSRNAQVFVSAMQHPNCPTVQSASLQDPTFDLNYADPGSIVLDPTNPSNAGPGRFLMIYEGTNRCVGLTGGNNVAAGNSFYSTIGIATSSDSGHTWPAYRFALDANGAPQFPLPSQNPSLGPNAPMGALGSAVCIGNDCTSPPWPPDKSYGRYAVLAPAVTVAAAMASPATYGGLSGNIGDSVPAAFVDDVGPGAVRYLYEVHNYVPGPPALGDPPLPNGNSALTIARAALNGGSAPLQFAKWRAGAFAQPGLGGSEDPIVPQGPAATCQATAQLQTMASISYVEDTKQYLLTFVCMSPGGDPMTGAAGPGAAWFYATNDDLSRPDQWSTPQEIAGSWSPYDPTVTTCSDYTGWYPTFMSLGHATGRLTTSGYVFHMAGCTDVGGGGNGRTYSSRQFTITTQ